MSPNIPCEECGESFDARGLENHVRFKHPEIYHSGADWWTGGAKEQDNDTVKTLNINPQMNENNDRETINCPECGSDNIADSGDMVKKLGSKLSAEAKGILKIESMYCADCSVAFSEVDL